MFANAVLLTCDTTQKKSVTDASTADEGTAALTNKLMSVKPKTYVWKAEDDAAPKSFGFAAAEVEAAFPECVRRTWRKETVAYLDEKDNKWKDSTGKTYDGSTIDKSRTAEYTIADPDWGLVYSNEALQYGVIDMTAMMAMLIKINRHLQTQVTSLQTQLNVAKADMIAVKARLSL